MPFERMLKELVDKVDARGAILLDWEGESVVHHGIIDDYQLKVIGAYQVIILNHMKRVKDTEKVRFFQIKFQTMIAQFMPVSNDYYVLLLFENPEFAAKALHNLTQLVDNFAKEIA